MLLERLKQLNSLRVEAKNAEPEEPPEGMPQLAPAPGKKNFRLQTDLQSAYEQVAAAFGLKATFDPELPARNVKLRLEDVDFQTAMKVLTAETGTFWKVLNSKLIFVAADTSEKRKALDTVIEQTFLLPDSTTPTEMSDVVRAVRDLTGTTRIQQSLNAHTVTIRDTVPRVRLAGAVIKDLEQSHGEVLLEMQFLEVDRNNAMKLGITPPPNLKMYSVPPNLASALRTAPSYTALLTLLASIFGTAATGGLSSLASAIPPIAAFGGGKSTFLLTLPSISADFSQSLSLVHSGTSGTPQGRRWQARHLFCRRTLSRHTFLALRKLVGRRPHPQHRRHLDRAAIPAVHRRARACGHGFGGFSRQRQPGSCGRQSGRQLAHHLAESRRQRSFPIRSSHRFAHFPWSSCLQFHAVGHCQSRRVPHRHQCRAAIHCCFSCSRLPSLLAAHRNSPPLAPLATAPRKTSPPT